MPKFRLNISIEFDDSEENANEHSIDVLKGLDLLYPAKVSLTRDGDKSGGNLLLPKLEGRMGSHYQGRKASIEEILNPKE
jgi:hypothetical protein